MKQIQLISLLRRSNKAAILNLSIYQLSAHSPEWAFFTLLKASQIVQDSVNPPLSTP